MDYVFKKKGCYYQLETVRTNFAKEDENKPNENVYILCPAQDQFKCPNVLGSNNIINLHF